MRKKKVTNKPAYYGKFFFCVCTGEGSLSLSLALTHSLTQSLSLRRSRSRSLCLTLSRLLSQKQKQSFNEYRREAKLQKKSLVEEAVTVAFERDRAKKKSSATALLTQAASCFFCTISLFSSLFYSFAVCSVISCIVCAYSFGVFLPPF